MTAVHRLLVVEDEVVVGIYLREELQDGGFEVVVENDAESALRTMRDQSFDAAIIDVELPGMSGLELMRTCRATSPDFRIILATGIDAETLGPELSSDPRCRVLAKPYDGRALFDCLVEMGLPAQGIATCV